MISVRASHLFKRKIKPLLAIQRKDAILITLLTIFDKGEIDTIKKKDAESILKEVLNELDTDA